jgi:ABC-2 type transport system permease protein
MNKYLHIAKTNFINSLMYIQDVFWSSVFIAIIIFIFFNLWTAIYGGAEYVAGFTIVMMLWYLVMSEAIVTSQSKTIDDIGEDITSGNIANYLNKPYNYIIYKYSFTIGKAILRFMLTFVMGGMVAYALLGPLAIKILTIPAILLIVILAITLNFLIMAFLGVFAFWLEDSRALAFVYSKIIFTIGGMLMPLDILPKWLYTISIYLPFSYVAYYPSKLFVAFEYTLFWKVLLIEIAWVTLFIILIAWAYKRYIKKLTVNGG